MKAVVRVVKYALLFAAMAGLGGAGYLTRDRWMPWLQPAKPAESSSSEPSPAATPSAKVILTDKAIENLRLTSALLKADTFWKTIQVSGMVVDRPGYSDRGVVAPVAGVVTAIHRFPGESVRSGDPLFTFKPLSEPLHQAQTELLKAVQDIKPAQAKRKRLEAAGGGIAGEQIIEVDNQIKRLEIAVRAYREELRTRGLSPAQIDGVAEGTFVTEIVIAVPPRPAADKLLVTVAASATGGAVPQPSPSFEIQELKVELGQQVQPGQTLSILANHQMLGIEGRAFRDETPLLERAVKEGWPVEVDFQEPEGSGWKAITEPFYIRHLANTIDPVNRTFAFLLPLDNESRVVERNGTVQLLWRFRPGQRVRLHVRIEKLENVFVLPGEAVIREGPEAFVFTQNVNAFERVPVRVLLQDRQRVVIANDGEFPVGVYVAQNAAAQMNRMLKAQSNTVPKGYHIHADGSLHKNEDEGK